MEESEYLEYKNRFEHMSEQVPHLNILITEKYIAQVTYRYRSDKKIQTYTVYTKGYRT